MQTKKINSSYPEDVSGAIPVGGGMNESSLAGISRKRELEVWEDFRKGNESAFILMYRLYFNLLVTYGSQFTTDKEIVKDAIQDLYIDLRKKRTDLSPLRFSLKFYLFKALKNNILQCLRKRKTADRHYFLFAVDQQAVDRPVEQKIIELQAHEDLKRRLRMAQEKLSRRQKEALFYLYYENFSYAEIQKLMCLRSIKSARNLVYGAIKALRENF